MELKDKVIITDGPDKGLKGYIINTRFISLFFMGMNEYLIKTDTKSIWKSDFDLRKVNKGE